MSRRWLVLWLILLAAGFGLMYGSYRWLADNTSKEQWAHDDTARETPRGVFYAYLAGMAMLLTAGSALAVGSYVGLAHRVKNRWLGPPLAEIERRVRLLYGVHAVYFGLTLVAALLIYEMPTVQDGLMAVVRGEVQSGKGVLGKAGEAYASKNIALAAGTTLAINFLVGSLCS